MKKKLKFSKFKLFRFLCLIAYILCSAVLIVESAMDGKSSAAQSNAVGGTIAGIVNTVGGDDSKKVLPTSLSIDNEIEQGYVGDTYQLKATTLPEDATFKSVEYLSSNESVASISNEGLISFIKAGTTTITASNPDYPSIKDSFTVSVYNVEATDLVYSIENATVQNDIYTLFIGYNYQIQATVLPENTTFKNIEYSVNSTSYLSVSESGLIQAKAYSKNQTTTLTMKVGQIIKEIKIIVEYENITLLEGFTTDKENFEIYATEKGTVKVNAIPSDATFKDYKLVSSNTKIVTISSKTQFVGKAAGSTTIKVVSTNYENIIKTFNVTVLEQPEITDFSITNSNIQLKQGASQTIKLTGIHKYANTKSVTYKSNNTSVATVSSSGSVKAVGEGNTTIFVTSKTMVKTVNVTVIKNETIDVTDPTTNFEVQYLQGQNPVVVISSSPYDLNSYFAATNFEYKDNQTSTNKTITFTLNSDYPNEGASISSNKLTVSEVGQIHIIMTHKASGISKNVSLRAISEFDVNFTDINTISTVYNVNTNQDITFKINQAKESELQSYDLKLNSQNSQIALLKDNLDGTYTIDISNIDGTFDLIVTPEYDNELLSEHSKTYSFVVSHILLNTLNLKVYDDNNFLIEPDEYNTINMYINDKLNLKTMINNEATNYNLKYSYSNPNVLEIDNKGNVVVKSIGVTTVKVYDTVSNIEKSLNFKVSNRILIDDKNTFTISGKDVSYNKETDTYSLLNGYSGKIKVNFLKESTYKVVTYKCSNNNVLTIGKDGTITPIKKGVAKVTIICDDGMQEKIEYVITIEIKPEPVIKNLSQFFYKVRKSLGHFGAFLVLGIFSTFTFMFYFRKWKWLFAVPLNIGLGFGLGALTEYIQTFIPGRAGRWADVMIDFSGFLCSAITLTVIILCTYLIKFIISKRKKIKYGE